MGVRRPKPCAPSLPGKDSVFHAETAEGRRGAEGACQPTDVCERFALGFATATSLPIRHAERVSASIQRPALPALAAKWTLKRVLGDESEDGVRGGDIVAEGTPEQVLKEPRSFTGPYLAMLLER